MGEIKYEWVIQKGGDQELRAILPRWMSLPMELAICQFVSEEDRWTEKINKLAWQGKDLDKRSREKHALWQNSLKRDMIFSQKKQCLVTTKKTTSKDLLLVKLHLSKKPEDLVVETANGEKFQLVLLKGQISDGFGESSLLDDLRQPVPQAALDALPEEGEDEDGDVDAPNDEGNDFDGPDEVDGHQYADAKAAFDAGEAYQEEEDGEGFEILADTDTDVEDFHQPSALPASVNPAKVKNFDNRPAFVNLGDLTQIPRHITGCSMGVHATTCQWQGYYPNTHTGLTAHWGGTTKRSEGEAILKVVRGILQAHCKAQPKDKLWLKQLEKVKHAETHAILWCSKLGLVPCCM